ncbi:hypothetical protein ACPCF3_00780 [Enterococcus mundtii]
MNRVQQNGVKYDRVLVQRNGHAFGLQHRYGAFGWVAMNQQKTEK